MYLYIILYQIIYFLNQVLTFTFYMHIQMRFLMVSVLEKTFYMKTASECIKTTFYPNIDTVLKNIEKLQKLDYF